MAFYQELRGLGPHGGLAVATAMSTAGEVVLTGWSERFGVHMGAMAILGTLRLKNHRAGIVMRTDLFCSFLSE